MKFSEDADKATYPGIKRIYRVWSQKDQASSSFDLISLQDDHFTLGD